MIPRPYRKLALTSVVKYDNIISSDRHGPENTARFMDQVSTQGIRSVPRRGQVDLHYCVDDRGRGRQSGYCVKTPKREIDLIKDRLKNLKEMLR